MEELAGRTLIFLFPLLTDGLRENNLSFDYIPFGNFHEVPLFRVNSLIATKCDGVRLYRSEKSESPLGK